MTGPEVWKRCHICDSIAEYSELVGTNPQDVDTIYYCHAHAETHMSEQERDQNRLEYFEPMVKVTFEWPAGGIETLIPLGFEEESEREKKSWEDHLARLRKLDNEDPEQ